MNADRYETGAEPGQQRQLAVGESDEPIVDTVVDPGRPRRVERFVEEGREAPEQRQPRRQEQHSGDRERSEGSPTPEGRQLHTTDR